MKQYEVDIVDYDNVLDDLFKENSSKIYSKGKQNWEVGTSKIYIYIYIAPVYDLNSSRSKITVLTKKEREDNAKHNYERVMLRETSISLDVNAPKLSSKDKETFLNRLKVK